MTKIRINYSSFDHTGGADWEEAYADWKEANDDVIRNTIDKPNLKLIIGKNKIPYSINERVADYLGITKHLGTFVNIVTLAGTLLLRLDVSRFENVLELKNYIKETLNKDIDGNETYESISLSTDGVLDNDMLKNLQPNEIIYLVRNVERETEIRTARALDEAEAERRRLAYEASAEILRQAEQERKKSMERSDQLRQKKNKLPKFREEYEGHLQEEMDNYYKKNQDALW